MRTIADAVEILQMLLEVVKEVGNDDDAIRGIELSIKTLKDRI